MGNGLAADDDREGATGDGSVADCDGEVSHNNQQRWWVTDWWQIATEKWQWAMDLWQMMTEKRHTTTNSGDGRWISGR